MPINNEAMTFLKTYLVLGPHYKAGERPKPVLPKDIVTLTLRYARAEEIRAIIEDLNTLLNRDELAFITKSQSLTSNPLLVESLTLVSKWASLPISKSIETYQQNIIPLFNFMANTINDHEKTPLMYAAHFGHFEVVQALLAVRGLIVNERDRDGLSALDRAIVKNHPKIVQVFLEIPGIFVWNGTFNYAKRSGYREVVKIIENHFEKATPRRNGLSSSVFN